jgi:hypothetical protein
MWQAIVFSFLGGLLAANGFPHFTRGITKKRYPCGLGNGPIPNFVAGWAAFVIAGLLAADLLVSHIAGNATILPWAGGPRDGRYSDDRWPYQQP